MNSNTSNQKWYKNVDFAWFGKDLSNNVGVFYVEPDCCPLNILSLYNQESYSRITAFVLDELEQITTFTSYIDEKWVVYDARKGLFVFNYNPQKKVYEKVASPSVVVDLQKFVDKELDPYIVNVGANFVTCSSLDLNNLQRSV